MMATFRRSGLATTVEVFTVAGIQTVYRATLASRGLADAAPAGSTGGPGDFLLVSLSPVQQLFISGLTSP
jgi:hypothetical protein